VVAVTEEFRCKATAGDGTSLTTRHQTKGKINSGLTAVIMAAVTTNSRQYLLLAGNHPHQELVGLQEVLPLPRRTLLVDMDETMAPLVANKLHSTVEDMGLLRRMVESAAGVMGIEGDVKHIEHASGVLGTSWVTAGFWVQAFASTVS